MLTVLLKPLYLESRNRLRLQLRSWRGVGGLLVGALSFIFAGVFTYCLAAPILSAPTRMETISRLLLLVIGEGVLIAGLSSFSFVSYLYRNYAIEQILSSPYPRSRLFVVAALLAAARSIWVFVLLFVPLMIRAGQYLAWSPCTTAALIGLGLLGLTCLSVLASAITAIVRYLFFSENRFRWDGAVALAGIVALVVVTGTPTTLQAVLDPAAGAPAFLFRLVVLFSVLTAAFLTIGSHIYSRDPLQHIARRSMVVKVPSRMVRLWHRSPIAGWSWYRAQRGIAIKELRLFLREPIQSIHLLLVLLLTLGLSSDVAGARQQLGLLPETLQPVWSFIGCLGLLCMVGTFTTALAARHALPALSLEGRSVWILVSAPVDLDSVLSGKHFFWWIVLGGSAAVITAAVACGVDAPLRQVVGSVVVALAFSYHVIAFAIAAGALRSRFDWYHPRQAEQAVTALAVTIGGCVLMTVNIGWYALAETVVFASGALFPGAQQELTAALHGAALFALALGNVVLARAVLRYCAYELREAIGMEVRS